MSHRDGYKNQNERLYIYPPLCTHLEFSFHIYKGTLHFPSDMCASLPPGHWEPLAQCLFMNPPMVSLRSLWGRDHYLLQLLIPSFHQKVLPYMEPKSGSLAFNLLLLVLPLRTICQPMLFSLVWNFRRWIHIQKQSSPRFQPSITPAVLLTTPHCWLLLHSLPTWNPVFWGFPMCYC